MSLRWRNLRPFFAWWANETDRPNPFDGTDQPRAAPPPPDVLAPEDVRALLATCGGRSFEDRRDRAVILTLLDTGARRGDLTGLRTGDWDRRTDLLPSTARPGSVWFRSLLLWARRWPATCGPGPTSPSRGWSGCGWASEAGSVSPVSPRSSPGGVSRRVWAGSTRTASPQLGALFPGCRRFRGRPHVPGRLEDRGHGPPLRRLGRRRAAREAARKLSLVERVIEG